jgi:isohexenylglutaconyl-CoA hydratase
MLTGRRFNGDDALAYGMVHSTAAPDALEEAVRQQVAELRHCAPGAIAAIKGLLFEVATKPLDDTVAYRANLLNSLRTGAEAQEGMMAFMQKRPAAWAAEK